MEGARVGGSGLIGWVVADLLAVTLGATVAGSCAVDSFLPTVVYRCDPSAEIRCPESHFCCSDDPAAAGGALPGYEGRDVPGGATPYFSGANNARGTSGLCVMRDDIPFGSGLRDEAAENCPIPCNPTWSDEDVAAVCGEGRVCCQTDALEDADCVVDPNDGSIRPVSGADIGVRYDDGTTVTDWSPGEHATQQDPGGVACRALASNPPDAELATNPVFLDCIAQLTVANQRGYCMTLAPGQLCPAAQPNFVDACTRLDQAK